VSRFQRMTRVDIDWLFPESHITIESVLAAVPLLTSRSSRRTLADLLVNPATLYRSYIILISAEESTPRVESRKFAPIPFPQVFFLRRRCAYEVACFGLGKFEEGVPGQRSVKWHKLPRSIDLRIVFRSPESVST
jgi:hypothetical protein